MPKVDIFLTGHKGELRQKYGIVIIGVFGSYAKGEKKETSDVDILVKVGRPLGLKSSLQSLS